MGPESFPCLVTSATPREVQTLKGSRLPQEQQAETVPRPHVTASHARIDGALDMQGSYGGQCSQTVILYPGSKFLELKPEVGRAVLSTCEHVLANFIP